ncbi:NUDIX domain-containing protein [Candidatus Roizmanbacteria bacterium]|nr:NUDIX domain-containing protein [Candidatus Roizmanbacteria bacterium]
MFYCYDGKGKILLHKRSKYCRDEVGRWDCGGGGLRFGESFEKAVKREIKEEYCAKPIEVKFVSMENVIRMNGNVKTHWVMALFSAKLDPKQVRIGVPKKMEDIGWFRLNKLPAPLHSMFHKHLEVIKKAKAL